MGHFFLGYMFGKSCDGRGNSSFEPILISPIMILLFNIWVYGTIRETTAWGQTLSKGQAAALGIVIIGGILALAIGLVFIKFVGLIIPFGVGIFWSIKACKILFWSIIPNIAIGLKVLGCAVLGFIIVSLVCYPYNAIHYSGTV